MDRLSDAEQLQQDHFNNIATQYAAHYGDRWSQKYRRRFINRPLLENIDLRGQKVVDAMCGNGEATGYFLELGAKVTGIDISEAEINTFRSRWPNCQAQCASVLSSGLDSNAYDCVVIVGGLHHLHPHVLEAVEEFHRILKVGGHLCFMEPHKGSLPDIIRQVWYRRDKLFAANEEAIDLERMKQTFAGKFKFRKEKYIGNLAFLFVFNSLIFRIPLRLKAFYSGTLIFLESIIERFQRKATSCIVICQWQKTR